MSWPRGPRLPSVSRPSHSVVLNRPPRLPIAHVWRVYRCDYLDSACGRIVRHARTSTLEPEHLTVCARCPYCPDEDRFVIR